MLQDNGEHGKTSGFHDHGPTVSLISVKYFPWSEAIQYGIACQGIRHSIMPGWWFWQKHYDQERQIHKQNKCLQDGQSVVLSMEEMV